MQFLSSYISTLSAWMRSLQYPLFYIVAFGIGFYIIYTLYHASIMYSKLRGYRNIRTSNYEVLNHLNQYIRSIHPSMYSVKLGTSETDNSKTMKRVKNHKHVEEFKKQYMTQLREPTVGEIGQLSSKCAAIDGMLKEYKLHRLREIPWHFIISKRNLEFGYPYTLGNTIVLPEHMVSDVSTETLLHEKIHVFQRMYPRLFDDLYTVLFPFMKKMDAPDIAFSDDIRKTEMTNPDGNSDIWLYFDKGVWFYPSLQLGTVSMTEEVGYAVESRLNPMKVDSRRRVPLRSLHALRSYPRSVSVYHPNEIIACLLSHQVVTGKKISKSITNLLNDDL